MHFVAKATSAVLVQLQKPTGVYPSTKQKQESQTFTFWHNNKESYIRLTIKSEEFLTHASNNH